MPPERLLYNMAVASLLKEAGIPGLIDYEEAARQAQAQRGQAVQGALPGMSGGSDFAANMVDLSLPGLTRDAEGLPGFLDTTYSKTLGRPSYAPINGPVKPDVAHASELHMPKYENILAQLVQGATGLPGMPSPPIPRMGSSSVPYADVVSDSRITGAPKSWEQQGSGQ